MQAHDIIEEKLDSMPPEILAIICQYLNPIDLYHLALSNSYLFSVTRIDSIWQENLQFYFDKEANQSIENAAIEQHQSCRLFSTIAKQRYQYLDHANRFIFLLLQDGDVESLLKQSFNIEMLKQGQTIPFPSFCLITIPQGHHAILDDMIRLYEHHHKIPMIVKENNQVCLYMYAELEDIYPVKAFQKKILDQALFEDFLFPDEGKIVIVKKSSEPYQKIMAMLGLAIKTELYSLVKKINDPLLNHYIFSQLCEYQPAYEPGELLKWAIILNIGGAQLRYILEGIDVSSLRIGEDCPPAYFATKLSSVSSLKVLLELGADPNLCFTRYNLPDPLTVAANMGNLEAIELLLSHGARADTLWRAGDHSALSIAAYRGYLPIIKCLHAQGAKLDVRIGKLPMIYFALAHGHADVMQYLTDHEVPLIDPEFIFNEAIKTIIEAVQKGYDAALKLFLNYVQEKQQELYVRFIHHHDADNRNLLYLAVANNRPNTCELLLSHHFDIDARDIKKVTPLYLASARGYSRIVDLFCRNYANVNLCVGNSSPLHVAIVNNHPKVVEVLLNNKKLKLNDPIGSQADIPLHLAVSQGRLEIINLFIQHPVCINFASIETGQTALHLAAAKLAMESTQEELIKYKKMIALLVQAGANPLALNLEGKTPRQLAVNESIRYLMEMLEEVQRHAKATFNISQPSIIIDIELIKNTLINFKKTLPGLHQAGLALTYLKHANTYFGSIVILCAANSSHETALSAALMKAAGFESKKDYAITLSNIIYAYLLNSLGVDRHVVIEFINSIMQPLKNEIFFNKINFSSRAHDFSTHPSIICLNFLESKLGEFEKLAFKKQISLKRKMEEGGEEDKENLESNTSTKKARR